jgi:hypothetical protein
MSGEKVFGEVPDYNFNKVVDEAIDKALKTKKHAYIGNF